MDNNELYLALELAIDDMDEYLTSFYEDAAEYKVTQKMDIDEKDMPKAKVSLRYLDLLQERLKKGQITQKYYDEQYDKIMSKNKNLEEPLSKKGAAALYNTGARPSKEKSPIKPSEFVPKEGGDYTLKNYRRHDNIDKVTAEKIKRHLDICRTTDDYNEYKTHYDAISKLVGLSKDEKRAGTLSDHPGVLQRNRGTDTYRFSLRRELDDNNKTDVDKSKTSGKQLFHTTSKDTDFKELKPRYRSSDGKLYASKRVYFGLGGVCGRNGGDSDTVPDNKDTYSYTAKDTDDVKYDPELHGGKAVFINTDKPLKVKKLKSGTKINEKNKES